IVENQARRVVLIKKAVAEIRFEIDFLVGAPRPGVAVDVDEIVVAGEKIGAVRHAMNWVVFTQCPIGRIRIVEERSIEMFEIESGGEFGPRRLFRRKRRCHGRNSVCASGSGGRGRTGDLRIMILFRSGANPLKCLFCVAVCRVYVAKIARSASASSAPSSCDGKRWPKRSSVITIEECP